MNEAIILQKLQDVNLSHEEALLYLNVLKVEDISVAELAKKAGLKRPSTYNYLDSLYNKQLISWENTPHGKRVSAIDPRNLSLQIDELMDQGKRAQSSLDELMPELSGLKVNTDFSTQVKYYHGAEGLKRMILNSLQTKDKRIYGYAPFKRSSIVGTEFMNDFRKKARDAKTYDHVIINDASIARAIPKEVTVKGYLKHQEVRSFPEDEFYISSDIIIYNDVYAVMSLDKKNPVGVEIINEEIAKTQMSIFNQLWKVADKVDWITS